MSSVHNIGQSPAVQKIIANPIQKSVGDSSASGPTRASDRLELSGASQFLAALKTNDAVRTDKVAGIRSQIEAGTYDDETKLDEAVDKLLDELNK